MTDPSDTKLSWKLQEYVAHVGNVHSLCIGRSSGRLLATGGEDKKINMWSLDKPNCLMSFSGHTGSVETVRFDNDEKRLASGCSSGIVKVWDVEEAKIIRHLSGHKAAVRDIEIYPIGEFAASASSDHNVRFWDLRRKGCIFIYKGHTAPVNCVRFTPDSRWMVSADDAGVIKIWAMETGKLISTLNEHTGPVNMVNFHPSQLLMASGSSDKSVKFWDLDCKKVICSTDTVQKGCPPVRTVLFHPEGNWMYSSAASMLNVYDWEPVKLYQSLDVSQFGQPTDLVISQNQLVGACISKSNVVTFVVQIQKLAPIAGESGSQLSELTRQHSNGASGRKTFVARQGSVAPAEKEGKSNPVVTSDEGSGDNGAVVVNDADYCRDQRPNQPFVAPGHIDGRNDARVFENQQVGGRDGVKPVSESDVLTSLSGGHATFSNVVSHRHRNLRIIRSEWMSNGPKTAVDIAVGMRDLSIVTDLLQVLLARRDVWDLSLCQTLLPTLSDLISSRHEHHNHIGLSALRHVLATFGAIIKSNVSSPPPQGIVDFARQERYMKCVSCNNKLLSIRSLLEQKTSQHDGRLRAKINEMLNLCQQVTRH